jgi:hypothetical protein
MAMPPILIGILAIATLLAKYALNFEWIPAIAVGLIASGIAGFALGKKSKMAVWLLLGGVVLYFLAPHLASISLPSAQPLQAATWQVSASAITSGVTLSGNQFIVPEVYNSTANSLSKDPVVLSFVVTRTDTGTNDASFVVSVSGYGKITDPSTGLQYDVVAKDAAQKEQIYIGSGTEYQATSRTYPMKFGTTQQALNVTIDLNPKGFDYLNNYESTSAVINVAGNTYTVIFQKTGEV